MKKLTLILDLFLLATILLLNIFVTDSLAAQTCPHGEAQYGFAHRVNDWDEIFGVIALLGANAIEMDICYSTAKERWVVSHYDAHVCHNPSAEYLDEWLHGKPGVVLGWEDLVNHPVLRKNMAALWVDVKTPNLGNLLDAVRKIQAATPTDISVVYELGELRVESMIAFQKIKDSLRSNEGIMFWANEVQHCTYIYNYFKDNQFTRNAVDHGHAVNIDEDVLIACNDPKFHDSDDPYRFKQVFTFTNRMSSSIRDYVNPHNAYCTSGQVVGNPLAEWPTGIIGPESMGWFFEVLDDFQDRRLATRDDVFWPSQPPEVSISLISQTVQYSDGIVPVTITATDIDSSDLGISVDLPEGLHLTEDSCINDAGTLTCTWTLDGRVLIGAGTYDFTFAVNDGKNEITVITTLIVETEAADVFFYGDNPVTVKVANAGGNSGIFDMMVGVNEMMPDLADIAAYAGDISLAQVSMTLQPIGPGSPVLGVCSTTGVSGIGYDSVNAFTCSFNDVPVNTYTAELTVIGDYYNGYREDVLVVYDPSLGFATGGGWFYWPATESEENDYPGDKTNFGFTVKYNKKGLKVQGNLQLISHQPDGTIYRIKSNALYGLALGEFSENGETCGWASFTGKSTYLEPGWPEPEGNHEFIVYTEDCNKPGSGTDQFWIQVLDKDGNVIDVMSMEKNATDHTCDLEGGNLVVPHGGGR